MTNGILEVITGCMFSGKTTMLIDKMNSMKSMGMDVLSITHTIDDRYGANMIVSHDNVQMRAVPLVSLMQVFQIKGYDECSVVCIDEAQFFEGLIDCVLHMVERDNKHVVVAGLDATYARKPFGEMMELVLYADHVHRLKGCCYKCDKPACFSIRIVGGTDTVLVGGSKMYQCACRVHYLVNTKRV
jgi:thymidine kinase